MSTTPTLEPVNAPAAPQRQGVLYFQAEQMLLDVFGVRFAFWLPGDGWQLTPSYLPVTGDVGARDVDPQACRRLCNAVRASLRPSFLELDVNTHLLGVPFIEYGRVNRVAVGLFDTNSPGLLLQLAHAFQQRWDEREERRRLQDENQGLSEQVSQDFEELMFLRHIAGELGDADLDGGLQAIAEQMLGLLNESIRAATLVFIEAAE
ncbi:MAG: hypothetical protein KDA41_21365, partial [Planctomycetales bacterium]|nr:hypothetical protein [Planctomycetales bacterium]